MPLYYRELYGEDGVVRWAKKWKVDAIIAQLKDVDVEKLNKLNIPIIIQNYKERADNICNITGDYFKTGEMAADFFMKGDFPILLIMVSMMQYGRANGRQAFVAV